MAKGKNGKELPKGIREKGDSYEGRVTFHGTTVSVSARTITETKKLMREAMYKLEHKQVQEKKIKYSKWFDTWLNEFKGKRVKIGTKVSYQKYYDSLIKPRFGEMYITNIRGDHIQKFYNDLAEEGYAVSTIKVVGAVLGGSLKQAEKLRMIEQNPVPLAELPREEERDSRTALTRNQQKLFMEYAKDSYLYYFFSVMLQTGMRNGEIRGLKYGDVDMGNRVIHVRRTLKYIEKVGYMEDTPKTKTSRRDIPLTEKIISAIENQRSYWTFKVEPIDRYLFCNELGKPLSRDRVQSEINRISAKIRADGNEFPRITPHVFRHTFATRALEEGMSPQVLKNILGHKSLAMTMDLYAHVLPDTKEEEMMKLAAVF